MNIKELKKFVNENAEKMIEILEKKNKDYSDPADVLAHFSRLDMACYIWNIDVKNILGVLQFYVIMKLDRLFNLINNEEFEPANESFEDTIIDLQNFISLLNIAIKEYKEIFKK